MNKIDMTIHVENQTLLLVLSQRCWDITLSWADLFQMGNGIGEIAFTMADHPSDPGQDEALAGTIQLTRCGDAQATLHFPGTDRFIWRKNTALIVADRLCKMAETIAEGLNEQRKRIVV